MKTDTMRGVTMVLLAAMLWGTTGTAQSYAPAGLSAYWVGALRLAVSALFFAGFLALAPRERRAGWGGLPWLGIVAGGVCMAAYNLAFFAGIRATGVGVGTAVTIGSGPVWAGLLQALLTRQAPPPAWWAGTALAVAGAVSMVLGNGAPVQASAAGITLCLLSGLSYAVYALVNKRLVAAAPASQVTLLVFAAAAALALPGAALLAGTPALGGAELAVVVYLGVAATGIAYLLFSHALRHISGATGVTLALGEPVTAFVLAIAVVGERPAASAYAGLLLVLAGLGAVVWAELGPARAQSEGTRGATA